MTLMKAVKHSSSDLLHHVVAEVLPINSWEGQRGACDPGAPMLLLMTLVQGSLQLIRQYQPILLLINDVFINQK